MPHLQFDVNKELTMNREKFFRICKESEFSEIMKTGSKSYCSKFKRVSKIFFDSWKSLNRRFCLFYESRYKRWKDD